MKPCLNSNISAHIFDETWSGSKSDKPSNNFGRFKERSVAKLKEAELKFREASIRLISEESELGFDLITEKTFLEVFRSLKTWVEFEEGLRD